MKILLAIIVTFTSSFVFACDFSKDVKENADGSFTYSRQCHAEVGRSIKSLRLMEEKVSLLDKKLELKDLQIDFQERRAQMWMETSNKIAGNMAAYEAVKSQDRWVSFGLGVGLAILSVYAARQTIR